MTKLKIGLIFGGQSGEHEVSLKSAKVVWDNLDAEKYEIIPIAITKSGDWLLGENGQRYMQENLPLAGSENGINLEQSQKLVGGDEQNIFSELKKLDLILPIGHGAFIEDGKLQGLLDTIGVAYVFSGTLASALSMNKQKTKLVAKNAGLKVAKEATLVKGKKYSTDKLVKKLGLPIVIKPIESGSSVGMSICKLESELETGINKAFEHSSEVMLEQFVSGREFTVAVWGNKTPKALPVVEIIPKVSEFFSYEAKYQAGGSEEICPANIPEDIRKKMQRYAIKIFKALGCCDLARADFIWSEKENKIYFLEINTIPGMTGTSLAPQAAKAVGLTFAQFLDKLINFALERKK